MSREKREKGTVQQLLLLWYMNQQIKQHTLQNNTT